MGVRYHKKGTVITIEGPRFSTKAESYMFRSWGADVINMSIATEATLAREAGLCYAAVAMSTDYDSWHESEKPVTWEEICRVMKGNANNVKQLFLKAVERINHSKACDCKTAIDSAL
jgi:5'-methylthioadenosine phosphorylase